MRVLSDLPLWGNLGVFAVAAVLVWRMGVRLSRGADAIADRTGLGQAFVGALLLGGTTSLPEIATTLTASIGGNAPLAVNNIFGGIALQVAILALADALIGRRALSATQRHPGVLLEGALLVLVLTVAAAGIAVGDAVIFGVGAWTAAVAALVVIGLFLIKHYEDQPAWRPTAEPEEQRGKERAEEIRDRWRRRPMRSVIANLAVACGGVFVGGFLIATTAERIAEQTGLGAGFVGVAMVAIATSLPEVSTTVEAARLGASLMAISNIFGTNLFDSSLLFLADIGYRGPAVLSEVGTFALVGALLGIACTTIYLAGILERHDRAFFRLGIDSILVLVVYTGGMVLLYTLR
ncbi:MAG: sodium:calcium antiporter [Thermoanaerobaculia bacterium]